MLSRPFKEYTLWGWDNLPRVVLMYYANFLSSPEGYFHTVICNALEFRNTTVNHDLHFISWGNSPKQHPHFLTIEHFQKIDSPFARKFGGPGPVLDKIDSLLLGCNAEGFVPGGWLVHKENLDNKTSSGYGVADSISLKPGPGADRLKRLINGLLSHEDFHRKQCV